MLAQAFKNLLVTCGAFYLSYWLHVPLSLVCGFLTDRIVYTGDFASIVVMPLVSNLPLALVAALGGAAIVWQIESARPIWWVVLAAMLYLLSGFGGYYWEHPPGLLDRVRQVVGAAFPAAACVVGGLISIRRVTASPRSRAV